MTFIHEQLRRGGWVPPWLRYQNLTRYQWASQQVRGCRVLEVGCGSGQGTKMLADAGAERVEGVDISRPSIEHARQHHATDRLSFQVVAGETLPIDDASYEVVVSLETIEHVADSDRFLREIVRVLRSDGRLFCSTPNRAITNPGTSITDRPFNRHHVREYTRGELHSLLAQYFASVHLMGQVPYGRGYAALLGRVGQLAPRTAVRIHQLRKVIGIPREHIERHRPAEILAGCEPEVLVTICSSPLSSSV